MNIQAGKSYTVKDWFANKTANEVKQNITMCEVFAVLKETEKAVYGMLNLGTGHKKTTWIPKSVLIEREIGKNDDETFNHETIIEENYDKAVELFNQHWSMYR